MKRISTKEAIVRIMAKDIGRRFNSYELVQKDVDGTFTGIAPMERAYDIIRKDHGIFESPNNRYFIEHRAPKEKGNLTKYAQFRVYKKEPLKQVYIKGMSALKNWTHGSPYQLT